MVHADGRTEKFPLPIGSKHPFNFVNSANFAFEVNFPFTFSHGSGLLILSSSRSRSGPGPGHVLVKVQVKVPDSNKLKIEASESKIGTWRDTKIKCPTHPPPTKLF